MVSVMITQQVPLVEVAEWHAEWHNICGLQWEIVRCLYQACQKQKCLKTADYLLEDQALQPYKSVFNNDGDGNGASTSIDSQGCCDVVQHCEGTMWFCINCAFDGKTVLRGCTWLPSLSYTVSENS